MLRHINIFREDEMGFIRLKFGVALFVFAGLIGWGSPVALSAEILRAAAGSPGAASHASMIVFAKIVKREVGQTIQINDSQTLSKTLLKLGLGQLDITPTVPVIYKFLTEGSRMYRKVSDQAKRASSNIRGILGWHAVFYQPVVFADTPVKTWADIKGKRVFTGPPAGAAAVNVENMIRIATGYEPNKEYKAVRLNWGSGLQAMMDGQLDVYVRPAPIGAAMIEQLGLSRKFRLLSLSREVISSEAWKKFQKRAAHTMGNIPAGTYKGQIGDTDVTVDAETMMLVTRKGLSDDLVYRMTKAFWTNIDEVHATVSTLKRMKPEEPVLSMDMPLHKGALRYYKEAGITIPARLVPPEAR
jgi:TRAP transporter TAXI family solute receptor